MVGKVINAIAFSRNTTHNAAPVCSGRAARIGDKVAIVVPPQIAVPEEIKAFVVRSLRASQPDSKPTIRVMQTNVATGIIGAADIE